MTAVISNYNNSKINELVHIDEAKHDDLEDVAMKLGEVLVKHGMSDILAVTRLHYHFTLNEDEKVVISRPLKSDEIKGGAKFISGVVTKTPSTTLTESELMPVNFLVTSDGSLMATEFMTLDLVKVSCLGHALKRVVNNEDFLIEVQDYLAKNRLHSKLGLQLIYEPQLLGQLNANEELHEDNWNRHQEMTYRVPSITDDATVTSWRFGQTVPIGPDKPITSSCVGRCYCTWTGMSHMHLSDGHDEYY